jgi:hypothetical protein
LCKTNKLLIVVVPNDYRPNSIKTMDAYFAGLTGYHLEIDYILGVENEQ